MLGLNIFSYYTTTYTEQADKTIARTTGEVTPIDERKLTGIGWIKVSESEYHFPKIVKKIKEVIKKKKEPESSLEDTDIF